MKKSREGSRDRLRKHFFSNVGRVMDSKELQEVSGGAAEWARRIRELRDEEGMKILTRNDDSSLGIGQYVLRDSKPGPAFARGISHKTRAIVLERNGYTCRMCGAEAGETHPEDPRGRKVRLHISHIRDKSKGGDDSPSNLRALCSLCNGGASNIAPSPPARVDLLVQIRRATSADQKAVLEWLLRKFPREEKGRGE